MLRHEFQEETSRLSQRGQVNGRRRRILDTIITSQNTQSLVGRQHFVNRMIEAVNEIDKRIQKVFDVGLQKLNGFLIPRFDGFA